MSESGSTSDLSTYVKSTRKPASVFDRRKATLVDVEHRLSSDEVMRLLTTRRSPEGVLAIVRFHARHRQQATW